jgi:hypothetical protein
MAGPAEGPVTASLEHFQEKWNPVFRPKVRAKKLEHIHVSMKHEFALATSYDDDKAGRRRQRDSTTAPLAIRAGNGHS